ncbi:hypothetical protein ASPWEDRAFT_41239 [Aspergillus wentii DTO 134E9]|uniref:Uncharacterized protein n=1 Tax=Aspergillus wentii DTO 134E9 TaxID=1073089 RepID=A0A1L9RM27_ASPWE|nr:uncharacterized protein ASPWEDRAFT_41239 [Aspergillus wentii DTO 134E9]OJJ36010.1 hypothetical protein ASPWEDRAFT_41239 [Aspergillus wentii DTO 134E9]
MSSNNRNPTPVPQTPANWPPKPRNSGNSFSPQSQQNVVPPKTPSFGQTTPLKAQPAAPVPQQGQKAWVTPPTPREDGPNKRPRLEGPATSTAMMATSSTELTAQPSPSARMSLISSLYTAAGESTPNYQGGHTEIVGELDGEIKNRKTKIGEKEKRIQELGFRIREAKLEIQEERLSIKELQFQVKLRDMEKTLRESAQTKRVTNGKTASAANS